MASRKELVEYDCQQQEAVAAASRVSPVTSPRDVIESPLKARKVPSCVKPQGSGRWSRTFYCGFIKFYRHKISTVLHGEVLFILPSWANVCHLALHFIWHNCGNLHSAKNYETTVSQCIYSCPMCSVCIVCPVVILVCINHESLWYWTVLEPVPAMDVPVQQ